MNSAFVKTHLSLFVSFPFFLHSFAYILSISPPSIILFSSILLSLSRSFSPMQPSSPGDYYSSVESDLKVELTEKLFALDTEGNSSPADTEVCVLFFSP